MDRWKDQTVSDLSNREVPGLHPGLNDLIRVLAKQAHCASRTLIVCEPVCYSKNYSESKYHKSCTSPRKGRSYDSLCRPSSLWSPIRPDSYYYDCFFYRSYPDRDSEYKEIQEKYNAIKEEKLDYSLPECDEGKIKAIVSGAKLGKSGQAKPYDIKASSDKRTDWFKASSRLPHLPHLRDGAGGGNQDVNELKAFSSARLRDGTSIRNLDDGGLEEFSSGHVSDNHYDPKTPSMRKEFSQKYPPGPDSRRNVVSGVDSVPCAELAEIRDLLKESDRETIKRLQEMLLLMKELSARDICRARCDSPGWRFEGKQKTAKEDEEPYPSEESETQFERGIISTRLKEDGQGPQGSKQSYQRRGDEAGAVEPLSSFMRDGYYPQTKSQLIDGVIGSQGSGKSRKLSGDHFRLQDSKTVYNQREGNIERQGSKIKQTDDDLGPQGSRKMYKQRDNEFNPQEPKKSSGQRRDDLEPQDLKRSYKRRDSDLGSQGLRKSFQQRKNDDFEPQESKKSYLQREDDLESRDSKKSHKKRDDELGPRGPMGMQQQKDDDYGPQGSTKSLDREYDGPQESVRNAFESRDGPFDSRLMDGDIGPHGPKQSYKHKDGLGSQRPIEGSRKTDDDSRTQESKRKYSESKDDGYGPNESKGSYYRLRDGDNEALGLEERGQKVSESGPQGSKTISKQTYEDLGPQWSSKSYKEKEYDQGTMGLPKGYGLVGSKESSQYMDSSKIRIEGYDSGETKKDMEGVESETSYLKMKMKKDADDEQKSISSVVRDFEGKGKKAVRDGGEDSKFDEGIGYPEARSDLDIVESHSLERNGTSRSKLGEESLTIAVDSEGSRGTLRGKLSPNIRTEDYEPGYGSDATESSSAFTESSSTDLSGRSNDPLTDSKTTDTEPDSNTSSSRSLREHHDELTSNCELGSSSSLTETSSQDRSRAAVRGGMKSQKQRTSPSSNVGKQDHPGSGTNYRIPVGKKSVPLTVHEVVELSNKITDAIMLEVIDELIKCELYLPPSRRYLQESDASMPAPASQGKSAGLRQKLEEEKGDSKASSRFKESSKELQMKRTNAFDGTVPATVVGSQIQSAGLREKLNERNPDTKAPSGLKESKKESQMKRSNAASRLSRIDESSFHEGLTRTPSKKPDESTRNIDPSKEITRKIDVSARDINLSGEFSRKPAGSNRGVGIKSSSVWPSPKVVNLVQNNSVRNSTAKQDVSTKDVTQGEERRSEEQQPFFPRHSKSLSPPSSQRRSSSCRLSEAQSRAKSAGEPSIEVTGLRGDSGPLKAWERRLSSQMKAAWEQGKSNVPQNQNEGRSSTPKRSNQSPVKGSDGNLNQLGKQKTQPVRAGDSSRDVITTKTDSLSTPSKQPGQMALRGFIVDSISGAPRSLPGRGQTLKDGISAESKKPHGIMNDLPPSMERGLPKDTSQRPIMTDEPCEPCQPDEYIATEYDTDESILYYARITNNAYPPVKETFHAAGFMLRSAYNYDIPPRSKVSVKTDLLLLLPRNSYGRIAPRKCMVENYGIDVVSDVIDRDYKGNITVVLFNHSDKSFAIQRGNKVAQLICESIHLARVEESKNLLK